MPVATDDAAPDGLTLIDDPALLATLDRPHRLVLGAPMRSAVPGGLYRADALPPAVLAEHAERERVPGAEVLAVPGHVLCGAGMLWASGRPFADSRIIPVEFVNRAREGRLPPLWLQGASGDGCDVLEIDAPVASVLNPNVSWGHFLLEMLPRLHVLAQLGAMGHRFQVAMPVDRPAWMQDFFPLFFAAEHIRPYSAATQRIRAPCFVLPGMMMLGYHLHPAFNTVVDDLLHRVIGAPPPPAVPGRYYLSRRRHDGWHGIANEAEVEAAMTDLGFSVLHPQELGLREQLRLYGAADCIVTQFSSAAHNALFAPRGAAVFCLGWMNGLQSRIAALRGQSVGYFAPRGGQVMYPPRARDRGGVRFEIDCRDLARAVPDFLQFAARQRRLAQAGPARSLL